MEDAVPIRGAIGIEIRLWASFSARHVDLRFGKHLVVDWGQSEPSILALKRAILLTVC